MRRLTRLSRRASLSAREPRELTRAQLELLRAQLSVWTRPRGRLVRPEVETDTPPGLAVKMTALRLARAISVASRRGLFRPNCLVRSIALGRMLDQAGIREWRMRIGVREQGGRFEAHSWVELGTQVLADSPEHVSSFQCLTDVRLVGAR